MGKNLELKLKVNGHDSFKKILKEINADFVEVLNQKDTYYKNENALLKLRNVNGRGEFIKYNRNEAEGERWSDYHILHLNPDDAEKFFDDVLAIETVVEKERSLYLYKDTRIHLDTVENLGTFLELETVVTNGLDEAREQFDEMIELLKLDLTGELKTSYRNLMLDK